MLLDINVRTGGNGIPIIEAIGEVDVSTSPLLQQKITDLLEAGDKTIVVDLSQTRFFDSTGLEVLLEGYNQLTEIQGSLPVICPKPKIKRVFEITGVNQIINIYDDEEKAFTDLRQQPIATA